MDLNQNTSVILQAYGSVLEGIKAIIDKFAIDEDAIGFIKGLFDGVFLMTFMLGAVIAIKSKPSEITKISKAMVCRIIFWFNKIYHNAYQSLV